MENPLDILFEDDQLLAVNKPADLVCHPTKEGPGSSLISRARLHLGADARPQLVNRLDRETSGVVLIAKTPESARGLRQAWETGAVTKIYSALAHGRLRHDHLVIDAPLGKDEASRVAIKDCVRPDGAPARTEIWLESSTASAGESSPPVSRLRVIPHTGRKHQIRIHLAHLGHPLVGDKLYGGDEDLYLALVERRLTAEQRARLILPCHALHAREVRISWRGFEETFRAPAPVWARP